MGPNSFFSESSHVEYQIKERSLENHASKYYALLLTLWLLERTFAMILFSTKNRFKNAALEKILILRSDFAEQDLSNTVRYP